MRRAPLARIEGDHPGQFVEIRSYSETAPDPEPSPAPPQEPGIAAAIVAFESKKWWQP